MTIFDFFERRFLHFYKAELNQKIDLYSGGSGLTVDISFVDFWLCLDHLMNNSL